MKLQSILHKAQRFLIMTRPSKNRKLLCLCKKLSPRSHKLIFQLVNFQLPLGRYSVKPQGCHLNRRKAWCLRFDCSQRLSPCYQPQSSILHYRIWIPKFFRLLMLLKKITSRIQRSSCQIHCLERAWCLAINKFIGCPKLGAFLHWTLMKKTSREGLHFYWLILKA